MKIIKDWNKIIIFLAIFSTGSALAFEVGGRRNDCRVPKFRSFSPPERIKKGPIPEVEPESEISFTVSRTADPESIRVVVKKQTLKALVVDKNSFFQVSAKLPATLNGKFARIDIWAKSKEGECKTEDGWLIKVKQAAEKEEIEKEEKKQEASTEE